MERRRILRNYRVKNVSGRTLEFSLTQSDGSVVELSLSDSSHIRGVKSNGLRLLKPWIDAGELAVEEEWEWVENNKHNWVLEGF